MLSVEVTETGGHQLVSRSSARGTSETPLAVRMPDDLGYTPEWPCRPLPESLSPADTWLRALLPAQEFKWGKGLPAVLLTPGGDRVLFKGLQSTLTDLWLFVNS